MYMGFFDALSGGVSNEPNFCEYSETFSDQPVRITCDTNFAASLPCTAIPYCVKIQIQVYPDPSNPDLISDAELNHITTVRSILGQHLDGRFVGQGIVASANMAFLIFYIPERRAKSAGKMLEESFSNAFRHTEYTIQLDPEGTQYMEYLFPNAIQLKQIENNKILRKLRGYGDDGSTPRPIKFHFVFPNRKAALEFSAEASEKDFAYEDLTQEAAPEGMVLPRYHLVLSRTLPFNIELLDLVDEYLLDLCERYEATYRSLETDVI